VSQHNQTRSAAAAVPVEFGVLGDLRASRGGRAIRLGSPQQRGILALLLLRAGKLVSPEELIDRMWGANPPASARVTVRTYISRLRRSLDDGRQDSVIQSTAGGYRLPLDSQTLDLARFEQRVAQARTARSAGDTTQASALLCAALALWRGYPLAGAHGQFVEQERDRLEQIRLGALEERICLDLELGRDDEIVAELIGLINDHPLRERLRELLMIALYRSSRQADALHTYQQIRALLRDELGIEPGPRLRILHEKILRSAPELSTVAFNKEEVFA
jgi:DNA-binding SARP family transcriptional activator